MKRLNLIFQIVVILLLLCSCLGLKKDYRYQDINDKSISIDSSANIDLNIRLIDENLNVGEDILLELKFVNNSKKIQKTLIDRPEL